MYLILGIDRRDREGNDNHCRHRKKNEMRVFAGREEKNSQINIAVKILMQLVTKEATHKIRPNCKKKIKESKLTDWLI